MPRKSNNPEAVPAVEEEIREQEAAPAAEEQAESERPARQRRAPRKEPETNFHYMQDGVFEMIDPVAVYKQEIDHVQSIIDHNMEVAKSGKGEYQYMIAMMTSNDEVRENNNPNKLREVRVYGVEVIPGSKALGSLRLVFTGDDFTAYSGLDAAENESESDALRRQRRYTNHAPLSKFQCVPIEIVYPDPDENGNIGSPSVICSRAFAMEQQQNKFFFGEKPLVEVGSHAPAYIMAADNNGVRVECMGIETRINRGQLTSRQIITDASEYYKPGMAIDVAVRELSIDKENRSVNIQLSGIMREVQLGLVKNVRDIDVSKKPHEVAEVIAFTPDFYIVRLIAWGIIGIIPKDGVQNKMPLAVMDKVFMEITGTNEKYNRVIGTCFKL